MPGCAHGRRFLGTPTGRFPGSSGGRFSGPDQTRTGSVSWTRGDQYWVLGNGPQVLLSPHPLAYIYRWARRWKGLHVLLLPCAGKPNAHAHFSPAAVPDLAVRRWSSSSYVWIPVEVLYVQHFRDRGIGADRGLHCPEQRATSTFRTCASSGNHRGLLPWLDLGLSRRKSFCLSCSDPTVVSEQ